MFKVNYKNTRTISISKFYFAKVNRENTKTMIKICANVKNVSVKNVLKIYKYI